MADQNNTIKTTVELDVNQAQQEVVKLNATASDSTKELDTRIQAKNKSVAISNKLADEQIKDLEEEVKLLEATGASTKQVEAAKKKLNAAKLKSTKATASNDKQLNKLNATQKKASSSTGKLDKATGGLFTKMKMLATNPIFVVMGVLAGIFNLVKTAINSTEDGSAKLSAIMAGLGQVFTNIVTVLSDLLQPALTFLVDLFSYNLNPIIDQLAGYMDVVKLAFKGFINYIELALTPIKALIASVKALSKWVSGDKEGAKKAFTDLGDSVKQSAKEMKENFSGAVKKAIDTTKGLSEAFKNVTKDAGGLMSKAAEIEMWQNRFNKNKREQLLIDAQLNTKSKQALSNSKNLALSWSERENALNKYLAIEKERNDTQKATIEEEIALQEARMSLGGNQIADEEKLNGLLIQRENLNAALATSEKAFYRLQTEFVNKRIAEEKLLAAEKQRIKDEEEALRLEQKQKLAEEEVANQEAQMELDQLEIDRLQQKGYQTLVLEQQLLDQKKQQELSNANLTEKEKQAIEEKYTKASIDLSLDAMNAKIAHDKAEANAKIQAGLQVSGSISSLLGSIFGENKAMAIALAGIDTIRGAVSAFASTPGGIVIKTLAAAAATAAGVSQIQKIRSTKPPAGISSTGGGGSAPTITAPTVPTTSRGDVTTEQTDLSRGAEQTASDRLATYKQQQVIFSENRYNEFRDQVQFKEERVSL